MVNSTENSKSQFSELTYSRENMLHKIEFKIHFYAKKILTYNLHLKNIFGAL